MKLHCIISSQIIKDSLPWYSLPTALHICFLIWQTVLVFHNLINGHASVKLFVTLFQAQLRLSHMCFQGYLRYQIKPQESRIFQPVNDSNNIGKINTLSLLHPVYFGFWITDKLTICVTYIETLFCLFGVFTVLCTENCLHD